MSRRKILGVSMFRQLKLLTLIILILIISFVSTACWSRIEMEERALVMGVGIDETQDELIELTVQILLPLELGVSGTEGGGDGEEEPVWVVKSTGQTIFDAIRNYIMKTGRRLFFQYNEILIIGEDVAQGEVSQVLDFFSRDHELRLNQYIAVTGGEAEQIIEAEHEQEQIPVEAIIDMIKGQESLGRSVEVDLLEFTKRLESEGAVAIAPNIELTEEDELKLTGIAVFDQNDELAGFFDTREARGVNWVLGEVSSTILVITSNEEEKEEDKKISIEVVEAESEVEADFVEGAPHISVSIDVEGNIGEQQIVMDISEEEVRQSLERKSAEVIRNEVSTAIAKAQDMRADVFAFGDEIYRGNPEQWQEIQEDWADEFSELDVDIEVNLDIRRTGVIRDRID